MISIGQLDINREMLLTLFNDTELKTYMGIPSTDINNIVAFRDKYAVNAYTTDALIINEISRLVYRNSNLSDIRNSMVKLDSLIIEIFTKSTEEYTVDPVDRLRRRQDKIWKRIYELLANKRISGFLFRLVDKGELMSGTQGYKRYFLKFEYKFIG